MCPVAIPFEAQRIETAALREGVERALRKLTDDDVALGFVLYPLKEGVCGDAGAVLDARGQLAGHLGKDPEQWKRVALVDAARQHGIVQDSGTSRYRHARRHDRAHGALPTREERRLMPQTAPHVAGLEVGASRLLDDRGSRP